MNVGWKHKNWKSDATFKLKTQATGGGNKEILVDFRFDYTIQELKKILVEGYKNSANKEIFERSAVHLGNHQGQIYDEFRNKNKSFVNSKILPKLILRID